MKAMVYSDFGKLEMREVERPVPNPGEALLKVSHVGICGSELEGFAKRSPRRKPPVIMGHEFSGTVVEVNNGDDSDIKPGDGVAANPLVTCGHCEFCRTGRTSICPNRQLLSMHRNGAFAEYVTVPLANLYGFRDNSSLHRGAFVEPCANAVHVLRLAQTPTPHYVAVMGAGTIGLMCAQVARLIGAPELMIVDVVPFRLELAKRNGFADHTVNAREENVVQSGKDFTRARGFDVVIDAAGLNETRRNSLELLAPGGVAVWIGTHDDDTTIAGMGTVTNERTIKGSYGFTDADFRKAVSLMESGKIEVESWTKTFPLDNGIEVFFSLLQGKTDFVKALLTP